jgi:predicted neuraminidase
MNIVMVSDTHLVAFYRSRWADFIYRTESRDGGATLQVPTPTLLPNNNSVTRANRQLLYPVLLEGQGNTLDIAFTWFRQGIKHVRLALL